MTKIVKQEIQMMVALHYIALWENPYIGMCLMPKYVGIFSQSYGVMLPSFIYVTQSMKTSLF